MFWVDDLQICRADGAGGKAAVNAPQSRRFAKFEDAGHARQRLDCGGFSTAFCRGARASARFSVRIGMTREIIANVLCVRTVKRRERRAPANDFRGRGSSHGGAGGFPVSDFRKCHLLCANAALDKNRTGRCQGAW